MLLLLLLIHLISCLLILLTICTLVIAYTGFLIALFLPALSLVLSLLVVWSDDYDWLLLNDFIALRTCMHLLIPHDSLPFELHDILGFVILQIIIDFFFGFLFILYRIWLLSELSSIFQNNFIINLSGHYRKLSVLLQHQGFVL